MGGTRATRRALVLGLAALAVGLAGNAQAGGRGARGHLFYPAPVRARRRLARIQHARRRRFAKVHGHRFAPRPVHRPLYRKGGWRPVSGKAFYGHNHAEPRLRVQRRPVRRHVPVAKPKFVFAVTVD